METKTHSKNSVRACQNCKKDFILEQEDFSFYEKIKVPPPTFCPECRLQRRLTWRNERTLYKRTCDLCFKKIISIYPQEAIFPVYCKECWFSDSWDATSFALEYDSNKTFFEQIYELFNKVPQIALQVTNSSNSDFINQAADCKNCYMLTSASYNEDCYYSNRILNSRCVFDSQSLNKVENSFNVIESRESSNLLNSIDCHNSFDLSFCYDVRNSNDCFMSANFRSKSNIWYGTQIDKKSFNYNYQNLNLGSYSKHKKLLDEFNYLKIKSVHSFSKQKKSINCTGNVIANSKNCRNCFFISEVENSGHLLFVDNARDTYDTNNGCCSMENIYEVNTTGINCSNVFFSSDVWPDVRDTFYSISCRSNVHNLFGCVGIRQNSYCILNKKYSKEEYQVLSKKIVEDMKNNPYMDSRGVEYSFGEFFPPEFSPFAFNESAAYTYTPLDKEEVLKKGWSWKNFENKSYIPTLKHENIPDDIKDVYISILDEIIECEHKENCSEQCTKVFRVIKRELDFYKQKNLPIPRLCPNCRHYARIKELGSFKLYNRMCMKEGCKNEFETSYAPERPEIIYCEKCYQSEVY